MDDFRVSRTRSPPTSPPGGCGRGTACRRSGGSRASGGIAPSTAARVYAELVRRGLVVGEVGRGTYVRAAEPAPDPRSPSPAARGSTWSSTSRSCPASPRAGREPGGHAARRRPRREPRPGRRHRYAGGPPRGRRDCSPAPVGRPIPSGSCSRATAGRPSPPRSPRSYRPEGGSASRRSRTPWSRASPPGSASRSCPWRWTSAASYPGGARRRPAARPLRAADAAQPARRHDAGGPPRRARGDAGGPGAARDRGHDLRVPPRRRAAPRGGAHGGRRQPVQAAGARPVAGVPRAARGPGRPRRLRGQAGGWTAQGFALGAATRWMSDGTAATIARAKREDAADAARIAASGWPGSAPAPNRARTTAGGGCQPWRAETFVAAAARRGIAVTPAAAFAAGPAHAPRAVRLALSAPPREILRRALEILAALARNPGDDPGVE